MCSMVTVSTMYGSILKFFSLGCTCNKHTKANVECSLQL